MVSQVEENPETAVDQRHASQHPSCMGLPYRCVVREARQFFVDLSLGIQACSSESLLKKPQRLTAVVGKGYALAQKRLSLATCAKHYEAEQA